MPQSARSETRWEPALTTVREAAGSVMTRAVRIHVTTRESE